MPVVLLSSLSVFALGCAVLRLGIKSRRLVPGDELRCPRCAYLLIGINSEQCPECGTPTKHAIKGTLHRRSAVIATGVLVALIGVYGTGFSWREPLTQAWWYKVAPLRALVWQQKYVATNYGWCWRELEDRVQ